MTRISGQTFYITTSNVNLMTHIRTYGEINSINLVVVRGPGDTLNVASLTYANENHGDFGLALEWDSFNILLIMYSYTNEKIYWMYNKGNSYSPWHLFSDTVI